MKREKLIQLMRHVKRTRGCWLWLGAQDKYGYGRVSKPCYGECLAHRAIYIHAGFKLEENDKLCHSCDNPTCVNPAHMFRGTQADNLRDARQKRRMRSKEVTIERALVILRQGRTQRDTATCIGVHELYLSKILQPLKRKPTCQQ